MFDDLAALARLDQQDVWQRAIEQRTLRDLRTRGRSRTCGDAHIAAQRVGLPVACSYGATEIWRMSMLAPAARASSRSRSTVPLPAGIFEALDSAMI